MDGWTVYKRKEGRKEGRKERCKEGWQEVRKERGKIKEGKLNGRTVGR